jgi:hypothetical protein
MGHHWEMAWLFAVIFGGGVAASYGLSRRGSAQYERSYGRPLARKGSVIFVVVVWGWAALGVGLIILFPHYWWLTILSMLLLSWWLFMFVMLRVRRGIKSDRLNKPDGFLDAFYRGGKRER